MPIIIHCSIVKTSKSYNGKFVSHYNIKDSELFNNLENYFNTDESLSKDINLAATLKDDSENKKPFKK